MPSIWTMRFTGLSSFLCENSRNLVPVLFSPVAGLILLDKTG